MTHAFKWLNLAQAIGAMIDNTFKMVTVIYLVSTLNRNLTETLSIATALLVIPFLLFSNWAGALTDRHSKRTLVIAVKWAELALLLLAFPALGSGRAWPMQTVLFLLAAQSAFFGPVKRGIVPELVAPEHLAQANGQMTGASYLAIILGLFLPSLAITTLHMSGAAVLAGCVALSAVGLFAPTVCRPHRRQTASPRPPSGSSPTRFAPCAHSTRASGSNAPRSGPSSFPASPLCSSRTSWSMPATSRRSPLKPAVTFFCWWPQASRSGLG